MAKPRHILPLPPPAPEAVARRMALLVESRERWAGERVIRLEALALGPVLRDVDAAADCRCACHPRPADSGLHDGGACCPCQLTDEERQYSLKDLFDHEPDPVAEAAWAAEVAAFEAEVERLGATVDHWGGVAPLQVKGVVHGRAFYFRCRHGSFAVTVADDDDPLGDPVINSDTGVYEVAAGDEDDLVDPDLPMSVVALRVAAQAVEDFQTRRTCSHVVIDGWPFCPCCGVRLSET